MSTESDDEVVLPSQPIEGHVPDAAPDAEPVPYTPTEDAVTGEIEAETDPEVEPDTEVETEEHPVADALRARFEEPEATTDSEES